MRTLAIDQVSAEVIAAFTTEKIPSILLKGPSIATWLYPAGGRGYCDTDLLVPGPLFRRSGEVLRELGFATPSDGFSPFELTLCGVETSFVRHANGAAGTAQVIDLHRSITGLTVPDDLVWETLNSEREALLVGGAEVQVLNRAGIALHIVLHAVSHGFHFHTEEDLRRAVATCEPDLWKRAAAIAATLGVEDILGFGLRHDADGDEARGTAVAVSLGLPTLPIEDSPDSWDEPQGAIALGGVWSGSFVDRVRWIRCTLFPSRAWISYGCGLVAPSRAELVRAYLTRWRNIAVRLVPAGRWALAQRRKTLRTRSSQRKPAG